MLTTLSGADWFPYANANQVSQVLILQSCGSFRKQKSQRTPAINHRSGWLQTLLFISPSEQLQVPRVWPHVTLEAFSMTGEALLGTNKYHIAKACQTALLKLLLIL